MSKTTAEESLINAIYNLEKNHGRMGTVEADNLMKEMVLSQMKYTLRELDEDYEATLQSLELKIEKGEEGGKK